MIQTTLEPVRGFIVQPTYRIEGGRAVFHVYGRLEDARPFLVRDRRPVPHFYVGREDAARAGRLLGRAFFDTDRVTFAGRPVVRFELDVPGDAPALRDRLAGSGIATYEADVRFAMRPLIERGIRGAISITGDGREVPGVGVVFEEPEIAPADWTPALRVLSLDIETDPAGRRLLSVALHGCGVSEVLLLTPPGWSCPAGARAFADERRLLAGFAARVRELDPDVLTGWNLVEFDLAVLARIAERLRVALDLGRGAGGALRLRPLGSPRGSLQASVPGRVVLDGIVLVRGAFIRMEDYTLDAVARAVLGEGKTLAGPHRAPEILRLFKEDRERFVAYNRTDARLALGILERLRLVELAIERSRVTGLPLDRVSGSIAAFDALYLCELGRRRIVAPSVSSVADSDAEPQSGGHVLEPLPGLYRNVVVLDFKSLYPSLIRTFEIDPLGLVRPEAGAGEPERLVRPEAGAGEPGGLVRPEGGAGDLDLIVAPNGAAFSRAKSILGALLDEIVPQREAARRAGDTVKSHALKILMNSFYGVLGTPACRFYEPRLANAITGFGREVLLWCKARIEERPDGVQPGAEQGRGGGEERAYAPGAERADGVQLVAEQGRGCGEERAYAPGAERADGVQPGAEPGRDGGCAGRGGMRVLYGDTDSLFVESGAATAAEARAFGLSLAARLTTELAAHVRARWGVESRLELAFDRLYVRLCLPVMRHSTGGARKRYAGLVESASGERQVVFTGMEAVRGDWTELAKEVQRELYARLFADEPVEAAPAAVAAPAAPAAVAVAEYLRGVVARLRSGALDSQLVYRKGLRKPPESYTTTTPPHVVAARLAGQRRGRIAYVITKAGPRPAPDGGETEWHGPEVGREQPKAGGGEGGGREGGGREGGGREGGGREGGGREGGGREGGGREGGGSGDRGSAPREGAHEPLDYDHYIETQLRAVAEPVLTLLGLDFATVVGSRRQLPLF